MPKRKQMAPIRGQELFPANVVRPAKEIVHPEIERANRKIKQPYPLLNFILTLVAPRGGGKTTVLIHLLKTVYKGIFDQVHLYCPTHNNDTKWRYVETNPDRTYDEYTDDHFGALARSTLKDDWYEYEDRDLKLVIFDDCVGAGTQRGEELNKFVFKHRHYLTSIIQCVQYFKQVGKSVRANLSHIILFNVFDHVELKDIATELGVDYRRLEAMMPRASDTDQHSFLYINRPLNRVYRNFTTDLGPLILPPEEDPTSEYYQGPPAKRVKPGSDDDE